MGEVKAGTRLRCGECGTEVVVVKAPADTPQCCGQTMQGPEASS